MNFEYKVMIIHVRRVLKWNSRVLRGPVNTVMGKPQGAVGTRGGPCFSQPWGGRWSGKGLVELSCLRIL